MGIQLTPSQQAVVDDQGGSLLVSAAAGSGKTRVLVERLFRRVLGGEQCNVDDFLIITYTRAAAAELRARIAEELSRRMADRPGDRHLQKQLLRVYRADIRTIDSFCTALLREYIHLLPAQDGLCLNQDFRVLDDNEAMLLRRRVLPRVLEDFYTDMTPGARQLADGFGFGRDDRGLEELVLNLYSKIQSHAYPLQWLEEQRAMWRDLPEQITETAYGREMLRMLERKAEHWKRLLRESVILMKDDASLAKGYASVFEDGAQQLELLAKAARTGWDEAAAFPLKWQGLKPVRKCAAPELKERLKNQWDICKKEMASTLAAFSVTQAQAVEDLRGIAPAMEALLSLCADFSYAYSREKLRRNATDFSDQEHFAIALLLGEDGRPTETAKAVAQRYREVMVDEYQDTNQVQNCIFQAISMEGRQLFTVGDVKQSIYRFRLADPSIFLEKYMTYPHVHQAVEGEPRKILLSRNFRSRQTVLDAANFVFRAIMSRDMGEMDYGDEEQLNFGADYLPERSDCQTEFHLIGVPTGRTEAGNTVSRPLAEARFVAQRIRRLLDEKYPVTEGEGMRPCRAEDIVILMRSPGPRLQLYTRALAEQDIPCSTQENENFFDSMEVAVTFSLLQILDNPHQDVPLISVLRSPVFGFTPDDLAVIRGKTRTGDFFDALCACRDTEKCGRFLEQLERLRLDVKDMSVHRLLWHLYNELNLLGVFGAMPGGDARREKLILLYEHARSFEGAGYKGLFSFVSHLRFLLENGEQPVTAAGSVTAGVRIMSIHKSKGLEFPIVFLADLNKDFATADFQPPVLIHPKLGLGPLYMDLERHIKYSTVARRAVEQTMSREMRAEEMRVLYVGMTRAKEKLIMVASARGVQKRLAGLMAVSSLPVAPETVDSAKSMADWIILPLLQRREAQELRVIAGMEEGIYALTEDSPWQVRYHDGADWGDPRFYSRAAADETETPMLEVRREILEYRYPYSEACTIPTKLTATQLKGREKDQEVAEQAPKPYRKNTFGKPLFLQKERPLTADERGTAVHTVLRHLPWQGDPAEVLRDLVERRLLTAEQGASVDLQMIRRFQTSQLAKELSGIDRMERELRFSIAVPARDYYPQAAAEDKIMLQGVVDLFAEDEDGIVVVDFKTDRVTDETLPAKAEQYRPQLETYSRALEKIYEKPVKRRVLYFLQTGQSVEL